MLRFAFLRAINVGGRRVRMEDLRLHFEAMGLDSVATFIASGNVIFESAHRSERALVARIEQHLQKSLGYEVATFLRSVDELAAIAAAGHGIAAAPGTLFVGFMREPPAGAAVQALRRLQPPGDALEVHGREVYWNRRGSFADSPIDGADLEKALRTPITLRNINTVGRLLTRYGA